MTAGSTRAAAAGKKHLRLLAEVLFMEARGIEPLSENPKTQVSPSAVRVLKFPLPHARGQAYGSGSFIVPIRRKA